MPIATDWHSAAMLTNSCIQSNLRSLGRRVPPSPLAPRIGSAPKARNNACNAAVVEERRAKFRDGSGTAFCPILNGCWTLAGGHGREVFENIDEKLTAHAEAGFTTFDTADIYGPSETILGKFQKQWTNSGKPALQLFTKYVPALYGSAPGTKAVETAMQKSLAALQVPQLDLVQMHWWDYSVNGMEDTALVLTDLQAKGLIKSVGVTNIDTNALEKILDAGVPIVSNQVQFSLLDRRPLNGMTQLCRDRGIKLMTYGSLGGGLLSDKYVEEPRKGLLGKPQYNNIDLNTSSLKMYWQVVNLFGGEDLYRRLLLTLKSIADRHGVSVANVALKWVMSQGGGDMIYPIVGLRNTSHILDNARVFGLVLDQADFDAIADVLKDAKGPGGDIYSFERGYA